MRGGEEKRGETGYGGLMTQGLILFIELDRSGQHGQRTNGRTDLQKFG